MSLINTLIDLNLISANQHVELYPRTRDRNDLRVMKCEQSGVIFLAGQDITGDSYYKQREIENDGKLSRSIFGGKAINTVSPQDANRRLGQFEATIIGKDVCDFGAGNGAFLDVAKHKARSVVGVELNQAHLNEMKERNLRVTDDSTSLKSESFDVVTLFHVLEHLEDPLSVLAEVKRVLRPSGKLVVEVPHAGDFLIQTLQPESFLGFTFWSEHLVLHRRASLEGILRAAGFGEIVTRGYQRYGLENHLYWLVKQKPGGHDTWEWMKSEGLTREYRAMLQSIDQTDTLISVSVKNDLNQ